MFQYDSYKEIELPKKKLTSTMEKAINKAEDFINKTFDEVTFEFGPDSETSVIELCEMSKQLKFDNDKAEAALQVSVSEAQDLCNKFNNEMKKLKYKNILKLELKHKDSEMSKLKLKIKILEDMELTETYISPRVLISTSMQTENEKKVVISNK